MVKLPEIWKAQLQLLAGFVSRDVVGGGAPLKLEKKTRATVNYDNTISTKALVRNHRALFCSSQTLLLKGKQTVATTISRTANRRGVYMTLSDKV